MSTIAKSQPARIDMSRYLVCVRNDGHRASLALRKLYEVLPDTGGRDLGLVRVIDESGESYLYPRDYFAKVALPEPTRRAFACMVDRPDTIPGRARRDTAPPFLVLPE